MELVFPQMVELGYEWVIQYGYLGIFVLLFLGVFGLPIPDEVILAFAGYLVFNGDLNLAPTMASAFVGAMGGISLSYALGHTAGTYLLEKHGSKFRLTAARIAHTHTWFERMGRWVLTLGYFVPGFRHVTALIAGSSGLGYYVFAGFAYSGALIWTGTYIIVGYYLGESWEKVSGQMHDQLLLVAAAAGLIACFYYLLRIRGRRPL